MPVVHQEEFYPRSNRTALLMEIVDKEGNPKIVIYHLSSPQITMETDYDVSFNIFDPTARVSPTQTKVIVEAYLSDARDFNGSQPVFDQKELEHTKAITDGDDEIVYESDEYEDWNEE